LFTEAKTTDKGFEQVETKNAHELPRENAGLACKRGREDKSAVFNNNVRIWTKLKIITVKVLLDLN